MASLFINFLHRIGTHRHWNLQKPTLSWSVNSPLNRWPKKYTRSAATTIWPAC